MVLVVMEGKIAYVPHCEKISNSLFWGKIREINLQRKTISNEKMFSRNFCSKIVRVNF